MQSSEHRTINLSKSLLLFLDIPNIDLTIKLFTTYVISRVETFQTRSGFVWQINWKNNRLSGYSEFNIYIYPDIRTKSIGWWPQSNIIRLEYPWKCWSSVSELLPCYLNLTKYNSSRLAPMNTFCPILKEWAKHY